MKEGDSIYKINVEPNNSKPYNIVKLKVTKEDAFSYQLYDEIRNYHDYIPLRNLICKDIDDIPLHGIYYSLYIIDDLDVVKNIFNYLYNKYLDKINSDKNNKIKSLKQEIEYIESEFNKIELDSNIILEKLINKLL